ncbi:paramyosin isoform X1 [Tribolium castaneum]|uniref:paramyosin isoform X1 n=1 Tax=Tribolium castaneum TaxID=7070 RepID=UPI0030FE7613
MMSGVIEDDRKKFKEHVKEMEQTVQTLENNLKESNQNEKELMLSVQNDQIKYQGISNQLKEALKENQQLINILQQKTNDQDTSRTNSQVDLSSSCSTMSIVHLQYKYEELLTNHHGLLKLLDIKSEEIKKVHEENVRLKTEIEQLRQNLLETEENLENLESKFYRMKEKKNEKINKLKAHKETLQMVHNQLVNVLDNQCMEKDSVMSDEIKNCRDSEKALLLQEIRKNNMLAYENFQLNQQVELLQSVLRAQKKNAK